MNEENNKQSSKKNPGKTLLPSPTIPSGGGKGGKVGIMKLISGFMSSLGSKQGKADDSGAQSGDVGTQLAHERTDLALDRNYMAAERTLMAWIRTALSMITFGFTIGKLGQVMESIEVKGIFQTRTLSIEGIAYGLVILGTIALAMATVQHRVRMHQLFSMGLRRQVSTSFVVAVLLVVVGGFALSSLVMAL